MPKVKKSKPYKKKYSEEDLQLAINAFKNGMSKKEASKLYHIPRATIQFRLSNKFTKITHGPAPILSQPEEKTLIEWITESHKKGFPRRKEDIQVSVKAFLDENGRKTPFKDNLPGNHWYESFLKRHPGLTERTAEAVTSSSAAISPQDLKKWFNGIMDYLKNKGYDSILNDPTRIFNGDETCFLLGPKETKVIAPKGSKNVYEVDRAVAKENLTVMFTFSASGITTSPMIIYPYKRLPPAVGNSVPNDWGIGLSNNGWMKSENFYEYVGKVFYPSLLKHGCEFPVILFVDGHRSHLTLQVSELCEKLKIILIALYPNATRILQPCDVAVFKPVKTLWKNSVLQWRRENPNEILNKEKFAPILKIVVDSINPLSIINGFRATGLYPFNFSAVDVSKCLGKRFENKYVEVSVDDTKDASGLSLNDFSNIVGPDNLKIIEHFEYKEADDGNTNYLCMLFKIWKHLKENKSTENNTSETFTNQLNIEDIPIVTYEQLVSDILSQNDKENNMLNSINLDEVNNKNTSVIDNDSELFITASLNDDNKTDMKNISSGSEIMETQEKNISMNSLLDWPKTPQRKNKRQVTKTSFVVTSTGWKKTQIDQKEQKDREENEKNKRKLARLAAQQQKKKDTENRTKKKLMKKLLTSKTTIKSNSLDSKLDEKNESNGTLGKDGLYLNILEKTPVKTVNVISTIVIKPQDICKRNIFSESPTINIEMLENRIVSGICYLCTYNITGHKPGLRCRKCYGRQYHLHCLKKENENVNINNFVCKSCSTLVPTRYGMDN